NPERDPITPHPRPRHAERCDCSKLAVNTDFANLHYRVSRATDTINSPKGCQCVFWREPQESRMTRRKLRRMSRGGSLGLRNRSNIAPTATVPMSAQGW